MKIENVFITPFGDQESVGAALERVSPDLISTVTDAVLDEMGVE